MKIGFLCPSLEVCGGVQRITAVIANALVEHHDISVISINNKEQRSYYELKPEIRQEFFHYHQSYRKDIVGGVIRRIERRYPTVLPAWLAKKVYFPEYIFRELGELLAGNGYDCIIGVTGYCAILLGLMKKYLPDIKLIGWQHNSYHIYYETRGKGFYIQRNLAKAVYKQLDQLVTLTGRDAEEYRKKMGLDCRYIYNPLGFQSGKKSSVESKRILFLGRLEIQQKGLDYLTEIIRRVILERNHKDWKIQIVGGGSGEDSLHKWIEEAGLNEYVEFLGEHSNVIPFYCGASIFVLTSRWEGFGLVVTEAMECGIPVVSFRTDGPSEVIQDGQNGYLIDKYSVEKFVDALERLMTDDELRKDFSLKAMKRAEDFYLGKIIDEWEKMLNE